MQKKVKNTKWTPEEDNYLMTSDGRTIAEKACNLGRSLKSATMRKYRLGKKNDTLRSAEWQEMCDHFDKIEKEVNEKSVVDFEKEIDQALQTKKPDRKIASPGVSIYENSNNFVSNCEGCTITDFENRIKNLEEEVRDISHQMYYDNFKGTEYTRRLVDQISEYLKLMKAETTIEIKNSRISEELDKKISEYFKQLKIDIIDEINKSKVEKITWYDKIKKFLYDNSHWQIWICMLLLTAFITPFSFKIATAIIVGSLIGMYIVKPVMIWCSKNDRR